MVKNIIIVFLFISISALAETRWNGTENNDYMNAANWSQDLPDMNDYPSIIPPNTSVILSNNTPPLKTLILNGQLTILSEGRLITQNGSQNINVGVGKGNTGVLTIKSGGGVVVAGSNNNLFIGNSTGGKGVVSVENEGILDARKSINIIHGKLTYAPTAIAYPNGLKNELLVDNQGTLAFQTEGSKIATLLGNGLNVNLAAHSTLDMQLGGTYAVGDQWVIIKGISAFSRIAESNEKGRFGNVINSLNPKDKFSVEYGDESSMPAEILVTLISAKLSLKTLLAQQMPPIVPQKHQPTKEPALLPIWPTTLLGNAPQSTTGFSRISPTEEVGQSFFLSDAAQINTILFQLDDDSESNDFENLKGSINLEIFSTREKSILVTSSVELSDDLNSGAFIRFIFPYPVVFPAGTYVLKLSTTDADIKFNATTGNNYRFGSLLENRKKGWREASPSGCDLIFGLTGTLESK